METVRRASSKLVEASWIFVAASIGAFLGFFHLGWRVINPVSLDWLNRDAATAHLGFAFLRQDPKWHFPLTFSPHLCYPLGASAAHSDSIPIAAVFCKLATSLFVPPDWRYLQYIGLVALGNSILQVVFGFLLCRMFTPSKTLALAGSILFGIAPPLLWRFVGHYSLTAQWIILAALWIYLDTAAFKTEGRQALAFTILLFFSGGVSPYLSIMALMIACASSGQRLWDDRSFSIKRIAAFTGPGLAMISSWVVFGFINPWDSVGYGGSGYRVFSMNLLAPIDPMFNSILLKNQFSFPGQYEGYNYLGVGVLLLCLLMLMSRFELFVRTALSRRFRCLQIVLIACTLLAASAKMTIGSTVLCDPHFPKSVESALSFFRSSGRLFWPAYYLILTFAIGFFLKNFRGARAGIFLALIIGLQFWDLQVLRASIKVNLSYAAHKELTLLKDDFWRHSGERFKKLIVLPPWQAGLWEGETLGGEDSWYQFGKLAAEQGMMTNVIYQGRTREADMKMQLETFPALMRQGKLESDALYVLVPRYLSWFLSAGYKDIRGKLVDGLPVFWKAPPSEENVAVLWDLFRAVQAGSKPGKLLCQVGTGFEGGGAELLHDWETGFATKDNSYLWSVGNMSGYPILRKANSPPIKTLELDLNPFLGGNLKEQKFSVSLNGKRIGDYSLSEQKMISLPVEGLMDGDDRGKDRMLMLTFDWKTASSPKWLGMTEDERLLAVGFRSIKCL